MLMHMHMQNTVISGYIYNKMILCVMVIYQEGSRFRKKMYFFEIIDLYCLCISI